MRGCPDGFSETVSTPNHHPRAPQPHPATIHGPHTTLQSDSRGGFALHEGPQRRVTGMSNPHVVQFPPRDHPKTTRTRRNRAPGVSSATSHPTACPPTGGFGSIRRPITACRRRVAPLMLQFPLATMSGPLKRAATAQPGPLLVTPHKKARPIPAPHRTARERLRNQTQSEDSNCNELIAISTRIHS